LIPDIVWDDELADEARGVDTVENVLGAAAADWLARLVALGPGTTVAEPTSADEEGDRT